MVIEMKNRCSFLLSGLATVTVTIVFVQFGLIQFDSGGIYADGTDSNTPDYYQLGYNQAEADIKDKIWQKDKYLSGALGVAGCGTYGLAYLYGASRDFDNNVIRADGLNVKIDEMSDKEIEMYFSGYEKRIKKMRFWTSTAGFFVCGPTVFIVILGLLHSP